ncbi:MAG TPA: endonuclease MutS2 [Nitrospirota bacterium]|nr:endonuclease MutS2 [Nitrospirota bacterium]
MNEHTLRVLEFDKIINIVAGYAASEVGRISVLNMLPTGDLSVAEERLNETNEFLQILERGLNPPLEGILVVGHAVAKLGVPGGMLTPTELLNTAVTMGAARRVKLFFERMDSRVTAPLIKAKADRIRPLKHIEDAVHSAIDERSEVKDVASPTLRKIRKRLAQTREEVLTRMSGILQDSGFQKIIQEPVITIRDDRYVLPLKPGFRQNIKGVVHGQSGSRATLFVEPLDVLEQNNRLAELRMEERDEVDRILRELTGLLSRESGTIEDMIQVLAEIDEISARARFGMEYGCAIPLLTRERGIRLRTARHPLLVWKQKTIGGNAVEPNDIMLSSCDRVLIISGPNAGGKTVILKTVGLLSFMAQSGLPVTAAEGSELPCFGSVFADIGDEQSIEQDLSTFSSHVSQIAEILQEADKNSLVLLDELGSGTDPSEGAGLGAAVLESLIERGSISLVTTHHNALKLFGSQTGGASNAAMEFDPQTLKPTYRLIPGRPGRSYGLDMAASLGVPAEVIGCARARIGEDDTRLDDLLKHMEQESRLLDLERQALEKDRSAAAQDRRESASMLTAAREEARSIRIHAQSEARDVLHALRQKLRELSRNVRIEQAEANRVNAEIETLGKKLEPDIEQQPAVTGSIRNIHAGDRVKIARLNKTGTVLALSRDTLELEVSGKKIKLQAADVAPAEPAVRQRPAVTISGWSTKLDEEEGVSDRLNILGLRVDEGLNEVDRFLDRAVFSHFSIVTVIHGLGTGALKAAVTKFLKNHPLVASIRPGEPLEGGAGVTVAELKK